jgi:Flp pilus assembly protein TadG
MRIHASGPSRGLSSGSLRTKRGQSMVEFALTAPLILLMLFGIVDFGRALFIANEMTNAAREGARVAVLSSNPCNTVVSSANAPNCSAGSGLTGESVCDAMTNEGQLIATWSGCTDPSGTLPNPPSSGSVDTAYVQITQSTNSSCPSTGSGGTVSTPRSVGNKAVLIQIWYYYTPLTPLVSKFFPSGYHMASSVCARPEY